jgi:putative ABC transport system ATP-binding protein
MSRLNEEFSKTIIMVTHDPRAAKRAKRTLMLEDGKLVSDTSRATVEHTA